MYMMSAKLIWQKIEKYFNFIIQAEEDIHNCVSFSLEKQDLLFNISNESSQHIGVEIKKFKPSTESNDLQVTNFTKIKKRKLEFEPRLLNLNITKISTIINETGLNEIVHIEGVVFDLKEEKVKFKDGREIRIQECKVKDDTAIIKLTIFGDLIDEVNENSSCKISYLRVAKYDYERYLKTTESSTVVIQPDLNIELTDVGKKEVENISTSIKVTIQVTSVDLKSFTPRLFCSNCNEDITSDEEFIICKKCDTMSHQTVNQIQL